MIQMPSIDDDNPVHKKLRDMSKLYFDMVPKADACDHDFKGWREFEDGRGGEQVCSKCGMGAMSFSLLSCT
jgi:hypothetical protein